MRQRVLSFKLVTLVFVYAIVLECMGGESLNSLLVYKNASYFSLILYVEQ